jgi:hypothetical protein
MDDIELRYRPDIQSLSVLRFLNSCTRPYGMPLAACKSGSKAACGCRSAVAFQMVFPSGFFNPGQPFNANVSIFGVKHKIRADSKL